MERAERQETVPGLGERLLREILDTPALKEVILLQMKDIRPEAASGLVKTLLWGDPGISMSLFGTLPQAANWLLEFLLELGRQLNGLPEPLLKDILGRIGAGIDRERARELPRVYGELARRLLVGEGRPPQEVAGALLPAINRAIQALDRSTARLEANRAQVVPALRRAWRETDRASLARSVRRLASLAVAAARPVPEEREAGGAAKVLKPAAAALLGLLVLRALTRARKRARKR